jgi:hypothetical protein
MLESLFGSNDEGKCLDCYTVRVMGSYKATHSSRCYQGSICEFHLLCMHVPIKFDAEEIVSASTDGEYQRFVAGRVSLATVCTLHV